MIAWKDPPRIEASKFAARLLDDLAAPAVAMRPERTLGADLAIWVIFSFFMRATDNAVRHDDRLDIVVLHESEDVVADGRVFANVALLVEPPLQHTRFGVLRFHDPRCDFAGARVIGAVERDGGCRIATKAAAGLLFQWRVGVAFELHDRPVS